MKCRLLAAAAAVLMLAGCADSSSKNDTSRSETVKSSLTTTTSSATAAQSSTTSATTTTKATTSATTMQTYKASEKINNTVPTSPDKTKPVVFNSGASSYHLLGTDFDINDYVSYGDDTDRQPKLTYTGKVDKDKAGDYPLKATVTDASGNAVSWELTVHVVSSLPKTSTTSNIPSMSFDEFKAKYKGSNVRYGIDVSQWQGSIDFKAVKNAGASFVFIRVGTKYDSYKLDPYFKTNLDSAIAAGLDVGVYLYTTDHTEQSARESAKWVVSQLGGKKLTMPVAFDWEELDCFQKFGASFGDINSAYTAFQSELAKSGYTTMLYGNPVTLSGIWNDSVKSSSPVWLAHYVENTNYSGNYGIWQICFGRISGIGGNTDFNVLYTDKRYK